MHNKMIGDLIGTYVEFRRARLDDEKLTGFVMAFNDDLTLLHRLDPDFRLDGYTVFLNRHVTEWTAFDRQEYFMNRAIRLKGIRPRKPRGVDISCLRSAFATAGERFPLLALHREGLRNDVCYVGEYLRSTAKTVTLYEITPTAEWDKATRFNLGDVTRFDFAGGCEDALWRVASEDGPAPTAGPN